MTTLKSVFVFWTPQSTTLQAILKVEAALLERRLKAIQKKQALLRVQAAATQSALEQIQQEMNA